MTEIKCVLTRNGFLIDMEKIDGQVFQFIKKKLTISHTSIMGKKKFIQQMFLYRILNLGTKQVLNLARFSGIKNLVNQKFPQIKIEYINKIQPGKDISHKFQPEDIVDLEDYQELCLNYLMDKIYTPEKLKTGSGSCIFVMDTGLGKTFTAAGLIGKLKVKTLIILPNRSNFKGWYDPFKIYLKSLEIGEYHATEKKDGDIVIMTIDSALNEIFKFKNLEINYQEYFKQFGLVIFDEIHSYPTKSYQEIFWRTNFPFGLGLTATPDERLDGMDPVYYAHSGTIIRAPEIPGFSNFLEELNWKGKVLKVKFYGEPEFTKQILNQQNITDTTEMLKQFSRDPRRIELILKIIKQKYFEGRYIFVFAVHRNILDCLMELLNQELGNQNCWNEEDMTKFMGGFTESEQKIAQEKARIIFTTYSFGKQSVSIERMDTIIFAQPIRNKMRQTIGRILRRGGNPEIEREIIDIVDMNTSLKSQYNTRKQVYLEKKFPIINFQIPEKK